MSVLKYKDPNTGQWCPVGGMQVDHTGGNVDLGVTGATVGQTVRISAVDEKGVPTAWESADFPSSGGNVELDTTLTQSGKAADAKAVGDALNDKLNASELPTAINTALAQAKASGEFKGDPGEPGQPGAPGDDYVLTPADKTEIAEMVAELVEVPSDEHINSLINTALGVIENGTY